MISGLFSLLPASYKGVSLLVTKESIESIGRKRVIHSYPKTDVQYAEDMGLSPDEFTIDIVFQGPSFQDDFDTFQSAIEDPDPGILILPTFGVYPGMIAMPATGEHDHSTLTNIIITVKFTHTVQQPSPTQAPPSIEDAFLTAITAFNNISKALSKTLKAPKTLNNILCLKNDMTAVINQIVQTTGGFLALGKLTITILENAVSNPETIANLLFGIPSGFLNQVYSQFGASTSPVPANTTTKLYTPSVVQPAFNGYKTLTLMGYNLASNMYEISSGFQPMGVIPSIDIPVWPSVTQEQIDRNNNRLALINSIRMWALINMMLQAVLNNYLTVQQLIDIINIIDTQYGLLIENDTTGVLIGDIISDLEAMKNSVLAVLNSDLQSNNVFQTTTIQIEKIMPATLLAYQLYGEKIQNEDDLDTYKDILISLNKSHPAHAFQPGYPITVLVM